MVTTQMNAWAGSTDVSSGRPSSAEIRTRNPGAPDLSEGQVRGRSHRCPCHVLGEKVISALSAQKDDELIAGSGLTSTTSATAQLRDGLPARSHDIDLATAHPVKHLDGAAATFGSSSSTGSRRRPAQVRTPNLAGEGPATGPGQGLGRLRAGHAAVVAQAAPGYPEPRWGQARSPSSPRRSRHGRGSPLDCGPRWPGDRRREPRGR